MNIEDYSPVAGTYIKLVSLSGQLIQYLRNTDATGDILKCEIEQIKNGGVNSIVFSVDRRTNIPIFPGLIIEVYKDYSKYAIAYSDTVPKPQSNSAELEVRCLGFMHKLSLSNVNKTYSSTSLSSIIADLETELNSVDIYYDASKIDLPAITPTNLDFEDKTLMEVMTSILQIANNDYENHQYRWFIDNDRKLNFEEIPQEAARGLYEGFNYQDPEVEDDDNKIVNRIYLWRTSAADNQVLEYVGTVEDTASQGQYGIRDKKMTFPDYVDNSTILLFGNGYLNKYKDPKTKISIDNLEGVDFPFSFYKLSNRIDDYWLLMSECDSFENWDLSGVSDTTVELSEEKVLTGRRSIKATTGDGSFGEFIQLNLENPVFGPKLFRMYLYLEESLTLEVTLLGADGQEYSFELGVAEFNLDVNETVSIEKHLEIASEVTYFSDSAYGDSNYGGNNFG